MRISMLACLLVLVATASATPPTWEVEALSYMHDLEFFEDTQIHQEGRTFFGQHLVTKAVLAPAPGLRLEAGLLFDVQFGRDHDENIDATEPYLALELDLDGPILRFGNLDRRRQDLHHALIAPGLRYTRPADRGFSLRRAGKRLDAVTWLQWRLQERVDRRELFDVGMQARWRPAGAADPFLDAQFHLVHRGGQLSSVGFLEESWGLLAGPAWRPRLGDDGWRADLALHGGLCTDRRWRHDGRALELKAGLEHDGWHLWATRWWSEDWTTMDGRALYRAPEVTGWALARRWERGPLAVDLGMRIHRIEGDNESEFWLLLDLRPLPSD